MSVLTTPETKQEIALYDDGLEVDTVAEEDYNLGYLLSWSTFQSVAKSLEWAVWQGITANPRFAGIHNLELIKSVAGYSTEISPDTLDAALDVRNEIIHRLSLMSLDHEVDVEVHSLLSGVGWANGYVRLFAEDEHARQQG